MLKPALSLIAALLLCSGAAAENVTFASKPALTPDGSQIYFSYSGDIYKVATNGGLALKVISMGGNETNPKISPDGKLLAFSSNEQGNNNVYVVPVAGGVITQLTFHDASDVPASWSPDSKGIYIESNRYNTRSTYYVPAEGGTPVRLFPHYFNTIANLVKNPATGEYYFNESTESFAFQTRKGYRGDHNPDIKSWNEKTKDYKELTDFRGRDIWPMVDKGGNLFYVSEEGNGEANIVRHADKKYLTSFEESVQYPAISHDGSKIVFIKGYRIHVLDLKSGESVEPQIELADNRILNDISVPVGRPQSFAISPDGKKLVFTFRGLLFVSDAKGNFVKQLPTPAGERADEAIWASDSKGVYYTRTNGGWTGLYFRSADLKTAETPLFTPESSIKSLVISPKGDKIAFVNGGKSLMVINTATKATEVLQNHEFWAFQSYPISFSFDGKHLAYAAVNLFERDIFIYDLGKKSSLNLTNSANFENDPVFSPDGKYLYILSNRVSSAFPRGAGTQVYKIALEKVVGPFAADEYDKLFVTAREKRDSSVVVRPDNIQRRYERVMSRGEQHSLFMVSRGEKSYLLFNSNHEGDWGLYVTELKEWDQKPPQKIKGIGMASAYSNGGKEFFAADREALYKVDLASATATKIDIKHNFAKNISDEFRQMFYEVWATLEQNFYDVKFHGVDWRAKRDYYAGFLKHVKSRDDLRVLLNDMLNELNSSHMGFSTAGKDEEAPSRYSTIATGLIFKNDSPYVLDRIVPGSKADYSGNPLKPGDKLVSVNGVKVESGKNRELYFASAALPREVVLGFMREGKEFDVKIHTMSSPELRSLLYTEWEDWNRAYVDSAANGKIAYLHMRDMSPESLEKFYIEINTIAVHKDALILDLRFNNGGNVHKEVIDMLSQREHFRWSHRDNPRVSHPNVTPADKPIIVLVNERSLSDAEVTSNGIKTLSLAKLVGTETYRWIIFTSSARLIDGSSVRLPAWGCYTLDGKDLEFEGVSPDIYVKNTFKDRLESKDPQLERAIKELLPL
jgi:tricorn protease